MDFLTTIEMQALTTANPAFSRGVDNGAAFSVTLGANKLKPYELFISGAIGTFGPAFASTSSSCP